MPWLALSVEVDAASAEALGDALLEHGAQSVAVDDPHAARSRLVVLVSLDARPEELLGAAARSCGLPPPAFSVTRVEDDDWVRRTQAQFTPILLGERLWVAPGWHEPPAGWPGAVVRLDPGMAFGTGSHPSTRLVLEYLARTLDGGERVLDYGCGSGILAIAAAKLGAAAVDAVDVDAQSLVTTAENARRNSVAVRAVLPEHLSPGVYDVVVANILAQPLILLAPLLAARVAPGGRLALCGILQSQAEEVAGAYAPWFRTARVDGPEGWALIAGTRS